MKKRLLIGAIAAMATLSPAALAADHQDGTAALSNAALDITDVFTWSDANGTDLNLIMNVFPAASATASSFADSGKYVFHLTSYASYGPPLGIAPADSSQVICTFDTGTPQNVQCWLLVNGNTVDYASGNATTTGIASRNGNFTVFTGPRQDPFFFNLDGFKDTIADVVSAAPALVDAGAFNANGCPQLDQPTVTALDTQLASATGGGLATDHFAGLNVLSIVVQLKTAAVTSTGHKVVGVWASTHI